MVDVKLVSSMEFSRLILTICHFCSMLKSLCKSNSAARRKFRTFTYKISALKRISTLINSNASFCDKGMESQRCKIPMGTETDCERTETWSQISWVPVPVVISNS